MSLCVTTLKQFGIGRFPYQSYIPFNHHAVPIAMEAKDVRQSFGSTIALDGVTVSVGSGELLAVVGESGSGKTTLLRCFNRLVEPASGVVSVAGRPVQAQSAVELRRHIGYVPQNGGLMPHWTIERNVALVPRLTNHVDPLGAAREALDLLGLPPASFGNRFPDQLSGGQRQRAAVARALAASQKVLLLDEPFGALDAISRNEVQDAFEGVRAKLGFTAMLITHDIAEAARLGDSIAVMRCGKIEQTGNLAELRDNPVTTYVEKLIAQAMHAAQVLTRQ